MKSDPEYEMWRSAISGDLHDEGVSESKTVSHTVHMSVNIQGFLRNAGKKDLTGIFSDENGKELSDSEARLMLQNALAKGWRKLPCSDCEGFDHFEHGCPGHSIE
ncbi:hypothetical protein [Dyadobacter sp. LHD-138]|uniref:hypothetical protein n=1 Tax=Dyadobacter sp. LHD-138 TaxID=3071413 RepID=UPI0027E1FD89|nr:hypothetical protein [Dyadobacter sp. LHD-138]MDQ6477813.1 hypothetical protein [Dyadobacter sp. LHD-138]